MIALVEVLIVIGIAAAVAVVGFRIGILIAPRLARRTEEEDGTDDRTE
jgi:hypothetical protein